MKIPMMQAIAAIRKEHTLLHVDKRGPNMEEKKSIALASRMACFEIIKNGELNINVISRLMEKHSSTIVKYAVELSKDGLIEIVFKPRTKTKIIGVI